MFKNDVFQLVNERSCGDPTCWSFDVEFDEPTTVYDFLKEVSTKLRRNSIQVEHGTVTIYDKLHPSIEDVKNSISISYRPDGGMDIDSLPVEILQSYIHSAKADGGWGLMNYDLYLSKGDEESELNSRARFIKTTDEQNERITKIRKAFSDIYNAVEDICESGRETSLVFTKLEEAQFWAIKGITREDVRK